MYDQGCHSTAFSCRSTAFSQNLQPIYSFLLSTAFLQLFRNFYSFSTAFAKLSQIWSNIVENDQFGQYLNQNFALRAPVATLSNISPKNVWSKRYKKPLVHRASQELRSCQVTQKSVKNGVLCRFSTKKSTAFSTAFWPWIYSFSTAFWEQIYSFLILTCGNPDSTFSRVA